MEGAVKQHFYSVLLLILLGLSACTSARQPVPMGTDTYYDGYINKGDKFGVRIGESREAAHALMIQHNEFYPATDALGNKKYDHYTCDATWQQYVACKPGETFDYYRKRDLGRDGRIFIFLKDDRVTAIYWDTSFLGTIDS